MPIPIPLDHVIGRLARPPELDALRRQARRRLSGAEAHAARPHVLHHKWLLSERLGRDVGLRAAAADYFDNFAA
jgi:hypothetical protein